MILIGDNSNSNIDLYQQVSKSFSEVYFTPTPTSILKQAITLQPELIILNVESLGERSNKLCESLKKQDTLANTSLILVNVPNEIHAKARGFQAGANDVITTPCDHFELFQRVKQQLARVKLKRQQQQRTAALRQTIKQQKALSTVIRRIHRSLDLERIFESTASEIHYALSCDRAVIYQFNSDWSGHFVAEAVSSEWRSLINSPNPEVEEINKTSAKNADSGECLIQVFDGSQKGLVEDTYLQENSGGVYQNREFAYRAVDNIYTAGFPECYLELLETFQAKAYVVLPIFLGDRLWGLLGIYQNDSPRQWQAAEKEMLVQIASQLGIALQQSALLTKLRNAKEQAEAASAAKSLFLANMSHELRTPLSSILGFTELLSGDPTLDEDQLDSLTCIRQSGKHLLDLINDVLSISQIEAGQLTLNPDTFELTECLNAIKDIMQNAAIKKAIKLIFQIDGNLPQYVYFDEAKLKQVLINLIGNAIKFTDKGQVILRVSYHADIKEAYRIRFEVIDTGFGIKPSEQTKLFQSFQQTSSGRQSKRGTGLGLAISQNLIQKMGGQIRVESQLGKGSRFWFELPVNAEFSSDEYKQMPITKNLGQDSTVEETAPKVLIIEDNPVQRELIELQLAGMGFKIDVAADGAEGIEKWRKDQPDVILLDLRMPSVDGPTVIEAINQAIADNPEYKKPKIIVITADVFYVEENENLSLACDEIIYKPVKPKRLLSTINHHLKNKNGS